MRRAGGDWLGTVLVLLAVVAAPLALDRARLERAERAALGVVVRRRSATWRCPVRAATRLGEPLAVGGTVLGAVLWSRQRGAQPPVTSALIRGAAGILLRRALADAIRRGRPPTAWWWDEPSGFSYPSRHVTWAVLGYGTAADLLRAGGSTTRVRYLMAAPPGLVAISRIVLAVHWPSDVAAAAVFGIGWRHLTRSRRCFAPYLQPGSSTPGSERP
jgi:membrane-associated phospholipid phosphatase